MRSLAPLPVLVTSLAVAAALLGDAMLYVVMPARPEFWELSIVHVGILLSANRFIRFFTNPASSFMVRKFGVYAPFKWTLLASLSVLVAYATSTSFILLLLARCMWGGCWSILRLVSQWIASDLSTEEDMGLNLATNASVIRVGSIGGAVFGGVLSDYIGYKVTFMIFAVFTLVSWVVWLRYCNRSLLTRDHLPVDNSPNFIKLLKDSDIFLLGISGLAVGIVITGLMSASLGYFIRSKFGVEFNFIWISITVTSFTGLMLGFKSFAEVFVGPFGGYISDRFGRLKVLLFSVCVAFVGLLLVGMTDNVLFTTAMLLLTFVGGVLLSMQLLPLVGLIAEKHSRSEVFSVYNTFQDVGSALGPFIGLSLINAQHLPYLYQSCSFLLVGMVILVILKFRKHFHQISA